MTRHLGLGPGREFDYIREIIARLGGAAAELGDDCALVPLGVTTLAVSIDASLEGVEALLPADGPAFHIWRLKEV